MIDWANDSHRAALLQLAVNGILRSSSQAQDLEQSLLADGWVKQTSRRRELAVTEDGAMHVRRIMEARWPGYRSDAQTLQELFGAITAQALRQLKKQVGIRDGKLPAFPPILNKKTFAAALCGHSKAAISAEMLARYPGVTLTVDQGVATRTHLGAQLRRIVGGVVKIINCDQLMDVMGVVQVSERAIIQGLSIEGTLPRAVLTIENVATFHDIILPSGLMAVLVEGWNTPMAARFLRLVPAAVPFIHFGDLDPTGFRIYAHLLELTGKPLHWFVPSIATDYIESHSMPLTTEEAGWGTTGAARHGHESIRILQEKGHWLEQEAVTLDPRLRFEIERAFRTLADQHSPPVIGKTRD
jgi:hypothetical protein